MEARYGQDVADTVLVRINLDDGQDSRVSAPSPVSQPAT